MSGIWLVASFCNWRILAIALIAERAAAVRTPRTAEMGGKRT
jgi:hypothetical protein|tara:strand:+ start:846 stop:971 length:126 start_codon:yes stop_codon:yes gene_type:complete